MRNLLLVLISIVAFTSCKNEQKFENNQTNISEELKSSASEIVGRWETEKKWNSGTPTSHNKV